MYDTLTKRIIKLINKDSLTRKEENYIVKWKEDYGFDDKIIYEAVQRAVKMKKTSFAYVDAILTNWHKKGISSYKDIINDDKEYFNNKDNSSDNNKKTSKKDNEYDGIFIENKKNSRVKNFVLDTNVLIHDPRCIYKFENNNIYIPHMVLEEIDNFKTERSERGFSAREVYRNLKKIRSEGNMLDGVSINEYGGRIHILFGERLDYSLLPDGFDRTKPDNIILLSVLTLMDRLGGDAVLVTNDCAMQLKADTLGIKSEEYKNDRGTKEDKRYKGLIDIYTNNDVFTKLIDTKQDDYLDNYVDINGEKLNLTENEYLIVKNTSNNSVLAKYSANIITKIYDNYEPMDIIPKNVKQRFTVHSCMNKEIENTVVVGPAGTGKTLLIIAAGLEQVMEKDKRVYKKILYTRPNVMMDEEIGFLPGSEQDKVFPLLRGLIDNLGVIFGNKDDTPSMVEDKIKELFQRGYIETESLGYLRGRSISDTYVIIDECQNASPRQLFSVLTRASSNSKFILCGDPEQIDNIRLDKYNNGLSYVLRKMKGSPCTDIITFDEEDCVRSRLAKEASERLKL